MTPPDDSRAFERIENPYYTGAPVRGSQVFFGREDQFSYVKQRLLAEREGIVLLFVGGRRCGKSSIMYQILDGRLGDQFLPVFIDMQGPGLVGDAGFLARLADFFIEAVDDERLVREYYDFEQGNPIVTFDRLLGDAKQIFPDRRMVFMVDEAELLHKKVEEDEISGNVLTYMASILESRQVSFFFTGSPGLGDVTGESWQRLLGKGDYREISFLSEQDTARLVQEPVAGSVRYDAGTVEAIRELTHGHPFYTQIICSNVVDYLNGVQENALNSEGLDEVVGTIVNNPPPQLVYEWEDFSQQERIVLSLLSEVSDGPDNPVSPEEMLQAVEVNEYPLDLKGDALRITLEALYESNVLDRTDEGNYYLLVDLMRRWIRRNRSIWRLLEETEPKKTSSVLWRGVAAASILAVVALVIWLSRGTDEATSPGQALPPPLTTGDLWIVEYPVGARILVDGEQRDLPETPTILRDLDQGPHTVVIQHNDHYDLEMAVMIDTVKVDTVNGMLQRRQGYLTVSSVPPGVRLAIQGDTSVDTTVPSGGLKLMKLSTGEYRIEATKAGYRREIQQVGIRDLAETTLEFSLPADVGDVEVASTPTRARVLVDGEDTGERTPTRLASLASGPHDLRLVLDDHEGKDTTVTVRYGKTVAVELTLVQKAAVVELISTPSGAHIYINDADTVWDQTPVVGRGLAPALYKFRFVLEGHHEQTIRQALAAGETLSKTVDLVAFTGELRLNGWGSVRIVNEATGEAWTHEAPNPSVPLAVGDYRIVGPTEEQTVRVLRDSTIMVKVK